MRRASGEAQQRRIRAIRGLVCNDAERFLTEHGGQAVGYGLKLTGGRPTGEHAIRLFVSRGAKAHPSGRPIDRVVRIADPESGDEMQVATDVDECSPCILHADFDPAAVHHPVPGGVSIGSTAGAGGTLGGWAWDLVHDQPVLLSNAHVLGEVVGPDPAVVIRQPLAPRLGSKDEPRLLGRLLRTDGLAAQSVRTVDCAIAAIPDLDRADFSVHGLGPAIMQLGEAQVEARVCKFGMATRLRRGRVTAPFWSGYIDEGITQPDGSRRRLLYRDCLKVESSSPTWAMHGDSGALVFASTGQTPAAGRAVLGLHFAGERDTASVGYACRIRNVCDTLQITTLPHGAARLLVDAPVRNAALATLLELWRRVTVPGRADHLRLLLSRHRARITDLVIRDGMVRRRAARVVAPLVGAGQSLSAALGVVIDADLQEAVASFCAVLGERAGDADLARSCEGVVTWIGTIAGRTVGDVLGGGAPSPTVAGPSKPFRTARAALRAYLQQDAVQLLERHGAIGVRMGRGPVIVLEFEGAAPASLPPVSFGGHTFTVTTEVKGRPIAKR